MSGDQYLCSIDIRNTAFNRVVGGRFVGIFSTKFGALRRALKRIKAMYNSYSTLAQFEIIITLFDNEERIVVKYKHIRKLLEERERSVI